LFKNWIIPIQVNEIKQLPQKMISYSQNREDVILNRIFKHRINGFYVDIGACHPVYDSVTKHFYDLGWRGVNIEPVPEMYALLREERVDDINLQLAITDKSGEIALFVPASPANSTCSPEVVQSYVNEGENPSKVIVETMSLNELWSTHIGDQQVDFLKIDVEGLENVILKSTDFGVVNPSILVVESTRPQSTDATFTEWEHLVTEYYRYFYFDGLNRFYHRKDFSIDSESVAIPPNVFDNYILWTEENLRRQCQKAEVINKELTDRISSDAENAERERAAFQKQFRDLEQAYQELLISQRRWEKSLLFRLFDRIHK
jgi:FkbM family methyltransferase